jgi:hypothetical protein
MKLFFIFILTTFAVPFLAQAQTCQQPTHSQLVEFFGNRSNWTQVEQGTEQMARRNVIQVRINFNRPLDSVILRNGEDMGRVSAICLEGDNRIRLRSGRRSIAVDRSGSGGRLMTRGLLNADFLPDSFLVEQRADLTRPIQGSATEGHQSTAASI